MQGRKNPLFSQNDNRRDPNFKNGKPILLKHFEFTLAEKKIIKVKPSLLFTNH